MKYLTRIAIAGIVATLAVAGYAADTSTGKTSKASANLVCPVTGGKIASIKDAAGHSTYKGKTYYFCCDGCKPMFDKNPAKYIKSGAAKPSN